MNTNNFLTNTFDNDNGRFDYLIVGTLNSIISSVYFLKTINKENLV